MKTILSERRFLALLGAVFSPAILGGCSLMLDPDVCDHDDDCNGGVCKDGICIGALMEVDASRPPVKPDATVMPDAEVPDAEVPDAEVPDAEVPDAIRCSLEVETLTSDESTQVSVSISEADVAATLSGSAIELDENGAYTGEMQLSEGANAVLLQAVAEDGRRCDVRLTVTADWTAPTLNLDEVNELTSAATYTLTGSVVDAHPADVLELNGSDAQATFRADHSFELPVSLVEGTNEFEIVAIDAVGNRSDAQSVVIERDSVPPTVTLSQPSSLSTVSGSEVMVSGLVADGRASSRAWVSLSSTASNGVVQRSQVRADESGAFSANVPIEVGANVIEACAMDAAQNQGCAVVTVIREVYEACVQNFAVDSTAIYNDRVLVTSPSVRFSGRTCQGVSRIELHAERADGYVSDVVNVSPNGSTFSGTFVLPESGIYTLVAVAIAPETRASDSVSLIYDSTAPEVSLSKPLDGVCTNSQVVEICGFARDFETGVASATVTDGTRDSSVSLSLSGDFCITRSISVGETTVQLSAENSAGLTGETEVSVKVDLEAPVVNFQECFPPRCFTPEVAEGQTAVSRYPLQDGMLRLRGNIESGLCDLTRFKINGSPVALTSDSFVVDVPAEEGEISVPFEVQDSAGNVKAFTVPFIVDTTPPEAEVPESLEIPVGETMARFQFSLFEDSDEIAPIALINAVPVTEFTGPTLENGRYRWTYEAQVPLSNVLPNFAGATGQISVTARDILENGTVYDIPIKRAANQDL